MEERVGEFQKKVYPSSWKTKVFSISSTSLTGRWLFITSSYSMYFSGTLSRKRGKNWKPKIWCRPKRRMKYSSSNVPNLAWQKGRSKSVYQLRMAGSTKKLPSPCLSPKGLSTSICRIFSKRRKAKISLISWIKLPGMWGRRKGNFWLNGVGYLRAHRPQSRNFYVRFLPAESQPS